MTRVVLVGAGHAHLDAIRHGRRISRLGAEITVVDPRTTFLYSGAIPAVLAGSVSEAAVRLPVRELAIDRGLRFIEGVVSRVDLDAGETVLSDNRRVAADLISVAVGSSTASRVEVAGDTALRSVCVKPLEHLLQLPGRIARMLAQADGPVRIVVAGGGASAVEIAAGLAAREEFRVPLERGDLRITIVARAESLLAGMPKRAGRIAHRRLEHLGVVVETGCGIISARAATLVCSAGLPRPFDVLILATGLAPNRIDGIPDRLTADDGTIAVDSRLRSRDARLVGGGDSVAVDGDCGIRPGVYAIRQGPILRRTISRAVAGRNGRAAVPSPRFRAPKHPLLILNLGRGCGLLVRGRFVASGRIWMALKERIDWAFVSTRGRTALPIRGRPPRGPVVTTSQIGR